ncbi:hypothetical protein L1987_19929 [Smallanthus sonchifolius]|uniref:Uncharacterized protein n=1 Tax=Smallanthus sonchifolius TaxID=185202 RepID=A0ACB9IR74_9ASTR|nr:hypothetical protein L1987_19929 [Smallanthus sonchifolius]
MNSTTAPGRRAVVTIMFCDLSLPDFKKPAEFLMSEIEGQKDTSYCNHDLKLKVGSPSLRSNSFEEGEDDSHGDPDSSLVAVGEFSGHIGATKWVNMIQINPP